MRISFAGGGTDLDYVLKKSGGAVINCTIDKYCHMTIEKRKDKKIMINNIKLSKKEKLAYEIINHYKPKYGFNLYYYNDIEPENGLGGSSSFTILLLKMLFELDDIFISDYDIVKIAYEIENKIKECGWQDQYACSIGGFNFMDFSDKHIIYPLRLRYRFLQDLNEHLLLVKVIGKKDDIHKNIRKFTEKNNEEIDKIKIMKNIAIKIRDELLKCNLNNIGFLLDENWNLKRNKFNCNKKIDNLYNLGLKNGAEGGKMCGSGQCGYFLFFVKPENKNKLLSSLNKYEILNFNFINTGVETWNYIN